MVELNAGALRLTLDPETGGAIAAFTDNGRPLLRPVVDPRLAAQNGRAVAGYPLMPYANRIAWGRFSFGGRAYQLARNFGDHPHTIHGNAWMHPWTVAEAGADQARLVFEHSPPGDPADEWPFAYGAEMTFALNPDGLRISLGLVNRDHVPWPAGLGLHPYVARGSGTALRLQADTVWTTANDLPDRRMAVQGQSEFALGRLLDGAEIDACYAGWGGTATVADADGQASLVLSAGPPMDHLQVYTPAGQDFLGLEPVSNMPDAVNRIGTEADQGLRILQPGERLHAVVTLAVGGLPRTAA